MKTIIGLFMALGAFSAHALPIHKAYPMSLPRTMSADYNFEGIIQLDDCSGALVRFENSKDTDPAIVITNGHCVESGFPAYGTYLYAQQSSRGLGLMDKDANVVANLSATQIIYSTMTGTDITIYRLQETYARILTDYGVHAMTLSSKHAEVNQPIEVISGYWSRGYACQIEAFIPQLHEGDWIWKDSMRYSRPGCETIGGTSGSPVLAKGTRTVIGINNTGNESGQKCTDDNPCEIDKNGNISWHRGYSYGEEILDIYSCLNANNEVDVATEGCKLFH